MTDNVDWGPPTLTSPEGKIVLKTKEDWDKAKQIIDRCACAPKPIDDALLALWKLLYKSGVAGGTINTLRWSAEWSRKLSHITITFVPEADV